MLHYWVRFWPGADDPAEVVRWALAREVHAGFSVVGSPHATVEEVGDALEWLYSVFTSIPDILLLLTDELVVVDDGSRSTDRSADPA